MPRARVLTDCPHSPCLLVQDCQTGHRTPLARVRSKAHVKEEEEEEVLSGLVHVRGACTSGHWHWPQVS